MADTKIAVTTVIVGLHGGGAEGQLVKLIEQTQDRADHKVIVLTSGGVWVSKLQELGVSVSEYPLRGWRALFRVVLIVRHVRRNNPDVLMGRMYHGALVASVASWFVKRPVRLVWSIHHTLDDWGKEKLSTRAAVWFGKLFSRSPAATVYVSQVSQKQHHAYGYSVDGSQVIPNGYSFAGLKFDDVARKKLREDWGIPQETVVFGMLARVHPMKDHANLFLAFDRARSGGFNLKLVIAGTGTDTLEIPAQLRGHVIALGHRTDAASVMSACDFGVLSSSRGEAFPNVLAEFMACGRPCVTTDVGDAALIVGELGVVAPPSDDAALAAGMLKLAQMSEADRERLSVACVQSIRNRFDISVTASKFMALWA